MKTNIYTTAGMLLLVLFTSFSFFSTVSYGAMPAEQEAPGAVTFSVAIPDALLSEILRQDYENQTIFSFKNDGGKPAFLFSVNRVTATQWLSIKSGVKNFTIIENQNETITFIQRTDQSQIKGRNNTQYQLVWQQLDSIIGSVRL